MYIGMSMFLVCVCLVLMMGGVQASSPASAAGHCTTALPTQPPAPAIKGIKCYVCTSCEDIDEYRNYTMKCLTQKCALISARWARNGTRAIFRACGACPPKPTPMERRITVPNPIFRDPVCEDCESDLCNMHPSLHPDTHLYITLIAATAAAAHLH